MYADMGKAKNIVLKKEWPFAGHQATVSQCQDSTGRVPGQTSRPGNRKQNYKSQCLKPDSFISECKADAGGGLADHCVVGSRVSLNCNIGYIPTWEKINSYLTFHFVHKNQFCGF